MRDLLLTVFVLCGLVATLRYPFAGLLMWVWVALMQPQEETYSFAHAIPWNLIIAIVTLGSWLVSPERKVPPRGFTTPAVLILLAWTTINTFYAFDPDWSWHYWDRAWKTIAMCILAGTLLTNRVRFHALMWIVAVSLCYYGVKGGIFTLATGGHSHVFGPPDSMLKDNNELGLALVMVLPILNYLRLHSGSRFVRNCLTISLVLTLAGILGTYSRAAYITLAVLAVIYWFRAKNKLFYVGATAVVLVPLLMFMPASFYQRAESIQQYNTDASFQSRVDSWWVSYRYAMDNAPFGAGFYGLNLHGVWDRYMPGEMHAAHSIYFQALGEQGIIGLALYLVVIIFCYLNLRAVMRDMRGKNELLWARNLAGAIQLSFLAFCVGGAAAPMAFFDLAFLWVLVSAALLELSRQNQLGTARRAAAVAVPSPMSA